MRVDDMISRATHLSGRTILTISTIIIASNWLNFKLSQLPLLHMVNLEDADNILRKIALPLIIFLLITHVLNWLNDRNGYLEKGHLTEVSSLNTNDPIVKKVLFDFLKSAGAASITNPDEIPKTDLAKLTAGVSSFTPRLDKVWKYTNHADRIALYGQHLIFPMVIGVSALFLL